MKNLNQQALKLISAGNLDPNMGDCYQTKADAINAITGPEHYDVLDVAHALHASCPMEYPDLFSAFNGAIDPFIMNPNLI